jgi:hypothetical protein
LDNADWVHGGCDQIPTFLFFVLLHCAVGVLSLSKFIGVFVLFALGADNVFVVVDKWKNARIRNQGGLVEEIAAVALPDAMVAMFLTSIMTAVAFF